MKLASKLALALTLIIGSAPFAKASLINPGFETGDLSGWTANNVGLASVVSSSFAYNGTVYNAVDGSYFLRLSAGAGAGVYTTASQTFLGAGQTISGSVAFAAFDYLPYIDTAFVKILDLNSNTLATPWISSVAAVGNYGNTPWTEWSWTAPVSGSYVLQYGVANFGDNAQSSIALFDAAETDPVPEPSTRCPPRRRSGGPRVEEEKVLPPLGIVTKVTHWGVNRGRGQVLKC